MTSFDPKNPTFSHERYAMLLEQTIEKIKSLGQLKGGEYAGDDDRLANFRRNAKKREVPMELIWAVYIDKHLDAINQYIDDIMKGKTRERLEPLEGRCDDAIVYLILFKCMIEERRIING